MTTGFGSLFCHPEPGPELNSGSNDFGISVLGFKNLGFKAPPCGRGSLLVGDCFSPFCNCLKEEKERNNKMEEFN
jgi:hypothetical protein